MATKDEDLDISKAIRILAFRAVETKEGGYTTRYVCRWYSREFHVPLPEVESIPFEEILQHFYECRYEAMEEEDIDEERRLLCETAAERIAREKTEAQQAINDDEFEKLIRDEVMAAKKKAAAQGVVDKPVPAKEEAIRTEAESAMPDSLAKPKADPVVRNIPEGIKMEFADDGELDDVGDCDIMGPPPKKKA